jgi:dihydroneopterin aldolase
MSVIALEGMRFYAYHGFYEEERIIGGEYIIDITVRVNTAGASENDDIRGTVNYETVYAICKMVMKEPSKLIEHVLERIIQQMKVTFSNLQAVSVKVSKLNPPLSGRVDRAWVEDEVELIGQCGRCKRGIICYGDEHCWCNNTRTVHPRTSEMLQRQFGPCLCMGCINYFAG